MKQGRGLLGRIELKIEAWLKAIPHLPTSGQRWLAENVWWMALVAAILSGISALVLMNTINQFTNPVSSFGYVLTPSYTGWEILTSIVSLCFVIVTGILLAAAVKPLRAIQKKGWMLLFVVALVDAINIVLGAILSLSVFGFITQVIFGAIGLAIVMYFLFEIRNQFAHVVTTTKPKTTK